MEKQELAKEKDPELRMVRDQKAKDERHLEDYESAVEKWKTEVVKSATDLREEMDKRTAEVAEVGGSGKTEGCGVLKILNDATLNLEHQNLWVKELEKNTTTLQMKIRTLEAESTAMALQPLLLTQKTKRRVLHIDFTISYDFRSDYMRKHLTSSHPLRWALYQEASDPEKKKFFGDQPIEIIKLDTSFKKIMTQVSLGNNLWDGDTTKTLGPSVDNCRMDSIEMALKEATRGIERWVFHRSMKPANKYKLLMEFAYGVASIMSGSQIVESDLSMLKGTRDDGRMRLSNYALEGQLQCTQHYELVKLYASIAKATA